MNCPSTRAVAIVRAAIVRLLVAAAAAASIAVTIPGASGLVTMVRAQAQTSSPAASAPATAPTPSKSLLPDVREACRITRSITAERLADCAPPRTATAEAGMAGWRCTARPWPTPPSDAVVVTTFGAVPDDEADDTDAIQRALDGLREGQWLVFPAGTYRHGRSLVVSKRGVTLWSNGATLHATNRSDQAIRIVADDVSVYRFRLLAVTEERGTMPLESRIAVYPFDEGTVTRNVLIRGNRITAQPGRIGLDNASTAAGIFLFRVDGFRIEDNVVSRSLADGIHVTAGSQRGLVTRNEVRETGDDTIGVVSYNNRPEGAGAAAEASRVRDVLIVDNDVGGQYFGRGIAVVGGEQVAILNNRIQDSAMAASVYVARESYWLSDGISRVLVAGNRIRDNQQRPPAWNFRNIWTEDRRTAQGAIELYTWIWADEGQSARRLGVDEVAICDNTIEKTRTAAIRIGAGSHEWVQGTDHRGRQSVLTNGPMTNVTVVGNGFSQVAAPFEIHGTVLDQVRCASGAAASDRCEQGPAAR